MMKIDLEKPGMGPLWESGNPDFESMRMSFYPIFVIPKRLHRFLIKKLFQSIWIRIRYKNTEMKEWYKEKPYSNKICCENKL